MLKETLNKYISPAAAPLPSSAPPMEQLASQTRQMSLNEPSTPYQYTPAPPPKPQGILQQQQTPSAPYGASNYQQQQAYQQPSPTVYTPPTYTQAAPQRPVYNNPPMYQANYGAPSPQVQNYAPTSVLPQNFVPPQHGFVLAHQQQGYVPPPLAHQPPPAGYAPPPLQQNFATQQPN
ncbi:hypothetical protein G6F68_016627 [Rhizopus microsporus]|nr:hypothetical protein G6F68_016627 [Rhizopus microsporus]